VIISFLFPYTVSMENKLYVRLILIGNVKGIRIMPFDYYILKIASRCNLNCTYCYMYNLADQTWRNKPRVMSKETMLAAVTRIADHAVRFNISHVSISFHGGEPLLLSQKSMQFLVNTIRDIFSINGISFDISLQTNAVLLNYEWAQFLHSNEINVGISMDGKKDVHDLKRIDHSGHGSYNKVIEGLMAARSYHDAKDNFDGVLCVINLEVDPIEQLEHFLSLQFRSIDFLLPEANYESLPAKKISFDSTFYADWLIKLFDYWFLLDDPSIRIRLFSVIIELLIGKGKGLDAIGGYPVSIAVIETDGEIEPLDVLKSVGDGITKTGLNVQTHQIDDLDNNYYIKLMQQGHEGLNETCQACRHLYVCGGGYLPHRYSLKGGFENPSVYCRDLYKLIDHIELRLQNLVELATN